MYYIPQMVKSVPALRDSPPKYWTNHRAFEPPYEIAAQIFYSNIFYFSQSHLGQIGQKNAHSTCLRCEFRQNGTHQGRVFFFWGGGGPADIFKPLTMQLEVADCKEGRTCSSSCLRTLTSDNDKL